MQSALYYYRSEENYENTKNFSLEGYNSIAGLAHFTEYEIDMLIAARHANFISYVLLVEENPEEFIYLYK